MSEVQTKWIDHGDEGAVIVRSQDVGAIVDYAKAMHNEGFTGRAGTKYVATIPNLAIEHYCNTKGITYREWCTNPEVRKRFLNDPDYADLRIWKGKV